MARADDWFWRVGSVVQLREALGSVLVMKTLAGETKLIRLAILVLGAWLFSPLSAAAAEQTVTLKVDGMTCASCPYQVQSALKRVRGVKAAVANLEKRNAVVTFDDAVTSVAELTKATADAGFPSMVDATATKPKDS